MGQEERRQQSMELKKRDIVDAAERVFFSKGYQSSSMNEVAKDAEFSKRTVYTYFTSKEQIYFEIMIRGYRLLLDRLERDLRETNPADALQELRCIFLTLFSFGQDHPDHFRAIMDYETKGSDNRPGVPDESRDECYRLGEQLFGHLAHALARGRAEGTFSDVADCGSAALTLWACAIGVLNTALKKASYLEGYHHVDPDEFVASSFDMITRLISTGGDPA
ncbi:TetR/AcrR family transcriptional regulator [Brooklawnia cerclae]|uniref:AcrR family transcriptional regulator n=1 Tax=Brooklawnia cerclae TaxID=349934 RepID=A0ABX0SHQ4_9ACTN|nr:TetR/AcrR family transcriptional regulator [Brooklawnia cerclae]NIH57928.1 AcrR family transcriptional regulator [Brooklawnia cerclae]